MQKNIRFIAGPWDAGLVLDKHMATSIHLGDDANGHPRFDNRRTEIGEAVFQLKYRSDWSQVAPLAMEIAGAVKNHGPMPDFIVPMPASQARTRQPVTELAREAAKLLGVPMADMILRKAATMPLKNLVGRAQKDAAVAGAFSITDVASRKDRYDVLLIDDLFDTGATMDAACAALRKWPKLGRLDVMALTWRK